MEIKNFLCHKRKRKAKKKLNQSATERAKQKRHPHISWCHSSSFFFFFYREVMLSGFLRREIYDLVGLF